MANNPNGAAECSIETFGSWVTETAAPNLPIGVSPDCPDNVFAPGIVGTRPGFEKIFNPPLAPGATITYGKSFVTPSKDIKNLYLDSLGNFYVEDVTNSPGVATVLFTTTPGTYCKSVTAFGREWLAINDGLHGQEAPLQYDGTNLDRVTMDGPGTPPTVANLAYPSVALGDPAIGGPYSPSSGPLGDQIGATVAGPAGGTATTTSGVFSGFPSVAVNPTDVLTLVVATQSLVDFNASFKWAGTGTVLYQYSIDSGATWTTFSTYVKSAPKSDGVTPVPATILTSVTGLNNIDTLQLRFIATITGAGGVGAITATTTGEIDSIALSSSTLTRNNNTVTGQTTTPHNLQVGYQALIAAVSASQVGGGIASVTIDNEDLPGIATITTNTPHGLVPDTDVFLNGITPVMLTISAYSYVNFVANITTTTPHGLAVGASILVSLGGGGIPFPETVTAILSPTEFVCGENTGGTFSGSGGNVAYEFPLANAFGAPTTPATLNANTYEVIAAPTPTTFQIAFEYTDGTWTGGTVSFAWNGTFFVTAVPTPTSFAYQQYGPNVSTGTTGTVTPYGQAAPGLHQLQMSWLTRQGYLSRPSPPVSFEANGGQYIAISDMAIGPPNVVARVLELTGALGSLFFYLPVPGQENGLVVSTATQVNDNTTASVVLDFSDNTLYAGLGTSRPGNNLAAQIVLDGALGFLFSSTRLGTAGQRNRLQNLLNMGFGGGYLPSTPTLPTGWTSTAAGGALGAGRFNGFNWQINTAGGGGSLAQSFYEDAYGAPIGTANTLYTIRYYLAGAGAFKATLSSATTGFSTTAQIVFTEAGWYEATFSAATPASIPVDLLYTISGINGVFTVAEGSVIYAATPYLDTLLFDSYVNNPEGMDGLSGKYGASQDTRKVMAWGIVRGNLCLLTQEPSGRLHEVIDNGTTEPSGWEVNELEANCGVLSAFALTVSQADDSSSSGGEEWMAWASESGARIFGGGDQWKISQEIQPNWYDPSTPAQVGAGQINMAAALTAWALNDPVARVIYFGLPLGAATAPNQIYPMNYRELDDAYTIAHSPPFHPSLSGKLVATDNTRKWCYWQRAFNGAARMYRNPSELTVCFFAGTGATPGVGGFGNVYLLNPALSTDDDYGQIGSYYVTCALPTHDQEQGLQLGSGKKLLAYLSAFFTCVGNVKFTFFRNAYIAGLPYQWPITFTRPSATYFDMEMGAGSPEANRIFIKIQPIPVVGGEGSAATDNRYQLERLIPWFRQAKIPVRGAAQ
jgi:hypothetical protein